MTDDDARPIPPDNTPPPVAGEEDDQHARERLARRRRSWRAVLIGLLALIVVVAVSLWIFHPVTTSPFSSVRADLARSAAMLRNAPALHYTGTINITGQGDARLDLVVSNPADALGTLRPSADHTLDYLGIDGKSFLRGDADAWRSMGMAEKATVLAEKPSLVPPGIFSQDLAAALAPPALAKTLLLEQIPDEKISVGAPVTIGDHSCTPIHADDMTICLGKELVGGARFVDRVVFAGGSAVVDIAAMPREAVTRFYDDFQSKLTVAREAVNPQIHVTAQVLSNYHGDCAPTVCSFTARVTVTFLGSDDDAAAVPAVQVNYAWVIDRDGNPAAVGPDCAGVVLIKPGQSSDLSCTATGPPVPDDALNRGQYHAAIHTSDVALTAVEYERLVRLAADNRQKVSALPDLPPPL